jgi:hypothetical protein
MTEAEVSCLQAVSSSQATPPKAIPRGSRVVVIELGKCRLVPPHLALLSYLRPAADGDALPTYDDVVPMRGYLWAFFFVAGITLIVGVCAAALAGWILTPARGSTWATLGGALIWLGAIVYGVGVGSWASLYYFATDKTTLDRPIGSALIDRVNNDTLHVLAVPITGAILIAVGSLALAAGLWRARTVSRWVVLAGAAASVALLALRPSSPAGVVVEAVSSLTTTMLGWYAWRGGAHKAADRVSFWGQVAGLPGRAWSASRHDVPGQSSPAASTETP